EPKCIKREPEDAGEHGAPEDLRDWIDRADLEHVQTAGLDEVLDAPGIDPVVGDQCGCGRVDEQPAERKHRSHAEKRRPLVCPSLHYAVGTQVSPSSSTLQWCSSDFHGPMRRPGRVFRFTRRFVDRLAVPGQGMLRYSTLPLRQYT